MRKKFKRSDNIIWLARKDGRYPNAFVECEGDKLSIGNWDSERMLIDRKLARLLAKRILQCLEET